MNEINDWVEEPQAEINDWVEETPTNALSPQQAANYKPVEPINSTQPIASGYRGLEQGVTGNLSDEIKAAYAAPIAALAQEGIDTSNMPLSAQIATKLAEFQGNRQNAYNEALAQNRAQLAQDIEQNPKSAIAGNVAGTILTGVGLAGTKAGQAIGNSYRNAGLFGKTAQGIGAGAASGAIYGAGGAEGDRVSGAEQGALVGGMVGGALPIAGAAIKGVKNAVLPNVEQSTAILANKAKEFGIPLSLDQIAPSKARNTLQKVSQEIPFSGTSGFEQTQEKAFNKALAKTLGQDADNLNPDVINSYLKKANSQFESVLKDKTLSIKDTQPLDNILYEAKNNITPEYAKIVENNINEIKSIVSKPEVSGKQLASARGFLVKRLPKVSGDAKSYISDIIDYIDNQVDLVSTPEEVAQLAQARNQWRNFKTIEPLLEKAPDGNINPTQLMNRVASSPYIKASRKSVGEDDLVDLARIGKEFLPKKGGSDTFQKTALSASLVGGVVEPTSAAITGGVALGNRAMQSLYNRNQGLINLAIKNGKVPVKEINALPPKEATKVIEMIKQGIKLNQGAASEKLDKTLTTPIKTM